MVSRLEPPRATSWVTTAKKNFNRKKPWAEIWHPYCDAQQTEMNDFIKIKISSAKDIDCFKRMMDKQTNTYYYCLFGCHMSNICVTQSTLIHTYIHTFDFHDHTLSDMTVYTWEIIRQIHCLLHCLQLPGGVTLVTGLKCRLWGLRADLHEAAAWCLDPLAWLANAASPMFKMLNALLHGSHFAHPGSWSLTPCFILVQVESDIIIFLALRKCTYPQSTNGNSGRSMTLSHNIMSRDVTDLPKHLSIV